MVEYFFIYTLYLQNSYYDKIHCCEDNNLYLHQCLDWKLVLTFSKQRTTTTSPPAGLAICRRDPTRILSSKYSFYYNIIWNKINWWGKSWHSSHQRVVDRTYNKSSTKKYKTILGDFFTNFIEINEIWNDRNTENLINKRQLATDV